MRAARNFVDSNCDELQLESALIESVSQCAMAQKFADLREPCDLLARRGIRHSLRGRAFTSKRFDFDVDRSFMENTILLNRSWKIQLCNFFQVHMTSNGCYISINVTEIYDRQFLNI